MLRYESMMHAYGSFTAELLGPLEEIHCDDMWHETRNQRHR